MTQSFIDLGEDVRWANSTYTIVFETNVELGRRFIKWLCPDYFGLIDWVLKGDTTNIS